MKFLRVLLGYVLALMLVCAAQCSANPKTIKLVVWGPKLSDEKEGLQAAIREFENRHPGVHVVFPSIDAGISNSGKLMTAIVGGTPPDVVRQERTEIGDWAARGAFRPLDDLVRRDRNTRYGIRHEDFYKACWEESIYDGKLYGIAYITDTRALFYNRELFRRAGLDTDNPPTTWEDLPEYAKRLTTYRKDGGFKQMGFIPLVGNCFLQMYRIANDGQAMSADGRRCLLNEPRTVQALDYVVHFYDKFGGADAVNAFTAGFKANELDPFVVGLVAMKIDGNWMMANLARYAPDLDFGIASVPVPQARLDGRGRFAGKPKHVTWSGGFAYVIPKGAKHADVAWEFIKWMVSEDCARVYNRAQKKANERIGRPFVFGLTANRRVNRMLLREFAPASSKLYKAQKTLVGMLEYSVPRPVSMVGATLWSEQLRACEFATRHKVTAKKALDAATCSIQRESDKAFGRDKYGFLNTAVVLVVVAVIAALGAAIVIVKYRGQPMGTMARRENLAGYLFASPWIIGFVIFTAGPIIASIVLSLCDYDVLNPARWIGFKNYSDLLTQERGLFLKSLYNVGFLAIFGLPLNLAVGLAIAMLLNTKVRGMSWYRTIYYLPSIVPMVANLILWMWVLQPEYGLINAAWRSTLTEWFRLQPPLWLGAESTAKPALILMGVWGAGGGIILWLAGLQGVPRSLYEAAELDGAGWWARLRGVTLPMLTPYIFFNLIMGTIAVLQTFEASFIMTGGGPADSTLVPALYLFNNAFVKFKMGFASALAWLLFIAVFALTMVQVKMAPRWVYYEHERGK